MPNYLLNSFNAGIKANTDLISIHSKNIEKSTDPEKNRENPQIIDKHGILNTRSERIEDKALFNLLIAQSSKTTYQNVIDINYKKIETIFGDIEGELSIDKLIQDFFNSATHLANDVNSSAYKQEFVHNASQLSKQIASLSYSINEIKIGLDKEVKSDIEHLNDAIKKLFDINQTIINKENTSIDLLDKRDNLIKQISEYIDIEVLYKEDTVNIMCKNGLDLVNTDTYASLNYIPKIGIDRGGENINPTPITLTHYSFKNDRFGTYNLIDNFAVEEKFRVENGKILGKTHMRDKILNRILSGIDEFANKITHEVNKIYSKGASTVEQKNLRSNITQTLNDKIDLEGSIGIGLLNTNSRDNLDNILMKMNFDQIQGNETKMSVEDILGEFNYFFDERRTSKRFALGRIDNFTAPSNWDAKSKQAAEFLVGDIKLIALPDKDGTKTIFDIEIENNSILDTKIALLDENDDIKNEYDIEKSTRMRLPNAVKIDLNNTNNIEIKMKVSGENNVGNGETYTINFMVDQNTISTKPNYTRYGPSLQSSPQLIELDPIGNKNAEASLTNGYLTIKTLDNDSNIFINDINSKERTTQKWFGHFFGFNNFFKENNESVKAINMELSENIVENPMNLALSSPIKNTSVAYNINNIFQLSESHSYTIGNSSNDIIFALNQLGNKVIDFNANDMIPEMNTNLLGYFTKYTSLIAQQQNDSKAILDRSTNIEQHLKDTLQNRVGIVSDDEFAKIYYHSQIHAMFLKSMKIIMDLTDKTLEIIK